jgi:hypothetical protein
LPANLSPPIAGSGSKGPNGEGLTFIGNSNVLSSVQYLGADFSLVDGSGPSGGQNRYKTGIDPGKMEASCPYTPRSLNQHTSR